MAPGGAIHGTVAVPGDKSVAHRWLLLATIANGRSELTGMPPALDVASTARACAVLSRAGEQLDAWVRMVEEADAVAALDPVVVDGAGRPALRSPDGAVDCGNSGTTMRLLAGVLAGSGVRAVLDGDASLRDRPMERVAEPLRRMGASVATTDGHAPVTVAGAALKGIRHEPSVPSAQVKSAVLLAGIAAEGRTEVVEPAPTRDHTERALRALGGVVADLPGGVAVAAFEVPGFAGTVPGDVSSAAFVTGAALVTGGRIEVDGVGLNPTRTRFLDVLARMGAEIDRETTGERLGEPVGTLRAGAGSALRGTVVPAVELPEVIDEIPLLAAVAGHAGGESRFEGAGELRVKESDRLSGLCELILGLGGDATVDGDALVVAGGGLRGGRVDSNGDHRMAMAAVVGALAAGGPSEIDGAEAAAVSFPGFTMTMLELGAGLEVLP